MSLLHKLVRPALAAAVVLAASLALAQEATLEATPEAAAETPASDAATPAAICAENVPAADPETRTFAAPEQVLEAGVDYRAVLCTGAGPIYVDLFEEYAPITVDSFVFLAQQGYYNNTTFHRVIEAFMAQGGDPTGTGSGGPGYQFQNEVVGFLNFDRAGWLAMANAGADTNGSQFFITTAPASHLDGGYTIFGEVLEGQENAEALRIRDPETDPEPGTALETVVIVTDPATVTTTYEPPAPVTQDQFQAAIDFIGVDIPAPLTVDAGASGIFTAEEAAAGAPEAAREDYAQFLADHNFEFRAQQRIVNATCDLESAPIASMSYTVDVFATREDASAALADEFLLGLPVQNGMAAAEIESARFPVFTGTVSECDADMVHALGYLQRGRYVITVESVYSNALSVSADQWLSLVIANQIYEPVFADVLRAEIR
jgi:cyclophilin family peptidyl-prolyl cis-trans isomerase